MIARHEKQAYPYKPSTRKRGAVMRKLQKFYAVAAVFVLVLGIVGCNLIDSDTDHPTLPANSSTSLTPMGSAQLGNFYVGQGVSDFYGVYIAGTSFVVNIPKPGTFLLTYYTKSGFGLSASAIDNLEEKGLPEDALKSLTLLVGTEFTTEEAFLDAISAAIGETQMLAYKDTI